MGGKSQTSSSNSTVSIPPEVLARYNAVNSQAQSVAQTPFQQYSADPNAFVAGLSPTQEAGIVGTNQYSSEAQPFYQRAANMTRQGSQAADPSNLNRSAINRYMNPYLSDVVDPTRRLMEQQFGQAQSGQMGNAIREGAFGGDRSAITAANLQQQQGLAFGQTMGGLYNQAYNNALQTAQQQQGVNLSAEQQNLARRMAGGAQMANIGAGAQTAGLAGAQAQMTAGQAQQQTEQAGLTAAYNQFLQQQSYPFQTTQFLANIAEGTGALSGSSTASSSTSPAPFFSDERLKDDIEPIGKTFDGTNIVKFRYKGSPHKQIGLIAQDVEKRHPEAVGLAGGYRTVDYDAATKDAASMGGSVSPSFERRAFASGGLSPNAASEAGFIVDPSYLSAQQEAYANAPWSNVGPVNENIPGKGRNIPTGSGTHAQLAVAPPPKPPPQEPSGLQQLSQGLGAVEKLGQTGKGLWNSGKGMLGGSSTSTSNTTPAPATGGLAPSAPADSHASPSGGGSGLAPPRSDPTSLAPSNDMITDASSSMDMSSPDAGLAAADMPDMSPDMASDASLGADILGDMSFAKRGGLIGRHHYEGGGGTPEQYNQPTDASQDDQSSGGDVPYESGTGSHGFDIPDDRSNNKLAIAPPPQQSGSGGEGGGFNPMSILGPVLGIFGLARGGLAGGDRVHRDDGGIAIDPDVAAANATVKASGLSPVPTVSQGVAAGQRGYWEPEGQKSEPNEGGIAGGLNGVRNALGQNQDMWVPVLKGLAGMASSNSRYLGSAILQGAGAAAQGYEDTQDEMAKRGLTGAEIGRTGAETGLLGAQTKQVGAQTGLTQAETERVGAGTQGVRMQNEQVLQAMQKGDVIEAAPGMYIVRMPDGSNIPIQKWMEMNYPPTLHQAKGPPGTGTPIGAPVPGAAPQPVPVPAPVPIPDAARGVPSKATDPSAYSFSVGVGPIGKQMAKEEAQVIHPDLQVANNKHILELKNQAAIAQGMKQQTMDYANSLMRPDGALATGAGIEGRTDFINLENTFLRVFNIPGIDPNTDEALAQQQMSQKLLMARQSAAASQMGEHAYAALDALGAGIPNAKMSPEAIRNVLAEEMVIAQNLIDKGAYAAKYANLAGGMPIGSNVDQAFNAEYDKSFYDTDKRALVNMMTPQKINPNYYQKHAGEAPDDKYIPFSYVTKSHGTEAHPGLVNAHNSPAAIEKFYKDPGLYRYINPRIL